MRTQTIIELLDITPEEQAHMQVLVSPEVRRARHREKERERTRRTGKVRQDRQTYLAEHTASEARAKALQWRQEGVTVSEIARRLGVSRQRVQQYLKGCKGSLPLYG